MSSVQDFLNTLRQLGIRLQKRGDKLQIKAPPDVMTPALRQQLAERKTDILAFLAVFDTSSEALPAIVPVSRDQVLPLSFSQERLWFLHQFEEHNSATYNIPMALQLTGHLDVEALQRSLRWLIDRHESLRTCFAVDNGQAFVRVLDVINVLTLHDLRHLRASEQHAEAKRIANAHAIAPFDLTNGPLFKADLLLLEKQPLNKPQSVLLLNMHHSISDGWSMGVFIRDWQHAYSAYLHGEQPSLAALAIQYSDYAVWQRRWLQGEVLQQQRDYWQQQLQGLPQLLELPTDKPRPAEQRYQGAHYAFSLSPALSNSLIQLSREHHVSLFMTLLGAFYILLSRYSSQDDICVGSPIANRTHGQTKDLIGFFINTLVLRGQLQTQLRFSELLQATRKTCLAAYAHQDIPFEMLVEQLRPTRSLSHHPLYQVMLVLQNNDLAELNLPGLEVADFAPDYPIAKLDLTLNVEERDGQLHCVWEYATDLFMAETIKRMARHFDVLLTGIVENPEQPIGQLPMLTGAQIRQLQDWSHATTDRVADKTSLDKTPLDKTIVDVFEQQVEETPNNTAVVFEGQALTYQQLNEKANQLAHDLLMRLNQAGITEHNPLIAIAVERCSDMLVGLLGILKAGGAYVPIDPHYPEQRFQYLLDDCSAPLLLTQRHLLHGLSLEKLVHTRLLVCLDDASHRSQPRVNPKVKSHASDLAYIIYTSGSTGQPKGVCVAHHGVVRLVKNTHYAQLDSRQTFLQYAPISFDAATFEIWGALLNSATLIIMPPRQNDLLSLATVLEQEPISILWLTSSVFNLMVEEHPQSLRQVKQILTGGEALSVTHINQAIELLPDTQLINGYGPTENTTFTCCYAIVDKHYQHSIPIGKPIANTGVFVLDKNGQPVPVGIIGELVTSGAGLARGYHNCPELNDKKFTKLADVGDSAFGKTVRIYKTGDRVRWLPDGNLEYIGRLDHQVKLRGLRIELGEIEALLHQYDGVKNAVVNLYEANDNKFLVAYITTDLASHEGLIVSLTDNLTRQLPDYMVPSHFRVLDKLPLTVNGKIDRTALPAPEFETMASCRPVTPTETLLANLWTALLKLEVINRHDNFFNLGGHSLLATQLIARIRDTFQVELPVRAVFEHAQLNTLAKAIESATAAVSLPPLERQSADEPKVLSFAQQRLWFLNQLEDNNSATYNIPVVLQLSGHLNVEALQHSLHWLIERHESLRTCFSHENGQAQVQVRDVIKPLSVHDLRHLCAQQQHTQLQYRIDLHGAARFDLAAGPLFKADLLLLDKQQSVLLLNMHHIISDGWSMGVLMRDWQYAYTVFAQNEQPKIPALDIQYSDYAAWQRRWLQGDVLQKQLHYWQQQLTGIAQLLTLPTDKPRPAKQRYQGAHYLSTLSAQLSKRITHLSREQNVSLFMTLLTTFYILLARYSRQNDICVGSPIANRTQSQCEDIIGFFVNILVLRAKLHAQQRFTDLLRETRQTSLAAYAHQDIPFEMLVEQLRPTRTLSHSPLFQVMFTLQNNEKIEWTLPGIEVRALPQVYSIAKFDLTLNVEERDGQLQCVWEYDTDLFEAASIERMAGHFEVLLTAIADNPEQPISQLPLLTETDQRQLQAWNNTATEYPTDKTLVDLFEAQVDKTPDNIALVFDNEHLSYRQLNDRANQLAHHLLAVLGQADVGVDKLLIAIAVERSLAMVVGLLGILKAGAAYVPIDPRYPSARIQQILADSGAALIVTQNELKASVPFASTTSCQRVCLDDPVLASLPTENPDFKGRAEDLAYVIYTSGSTGKPKGAMNAHIGIVNRLLWMQETYPLTVDDCILQKTPFSFDVSVWEFFWPLLTGARLAIAKAQGHKDPVYLAELIARHNVTVLHFVPSMLHVFLNHTDLSDCTSLKRVLCSGEALTVELVKLFFTHRRDLAIELHNLYGPTEAAVDVSYWPCSIDTVYPSAGVDNGIAIGKPIANTQLYVVDAHNQIVPVGVPGELVIAGRQVGYGYLNQPELTAEKFIDIELFGKTERIFKTGDLTRWLPSGNLEYLGRIDQQVKLRGFRIELGEIETAISRHAGVKEAVVTLFDKKIDNDRFDKERFDNKCLVAYFTTDSVSNNLVVSLQDHLKSCLPDYMIPSHFMALNKLPLTTNGKIDRNALPDPTPSLGSEEDYSAPRTPAEKKCADIWANVLGIKKVGIHHNFFELGGHSLSGVQLVAQINYAFSSDIALRDLFDAPTVAELALKVSCVTPVDNATFDINAEVQLIGAVGRHLATDPGEPVTPKTLLLTGATGFLGAFLLRELLQQTTADIYCLVRGASDEEARQRLIDQLTLYQVCNTVLPSRVIVLRGDLSQRSLGLSQACFERLAQHIDVIYHSGALVNHVYSYSVLKNSNVSGTQEILRLTVSHKLKPIHYVSTTGVLGIVNPQGGILTEQDLPEDGNRLNSGYNQSKWVAEKILRRANALGVPVTVYRPNVIGGHSCSGVWAVKDFRSLMIYSCLKLGVWPTLDLSWNIAPVDYVSKAIVYLSMQPESQGETFHPVNAQDISIRQIFEIIASLGYPSEPCPPNEWKTRLRDTAKTSADDNLLSLSTFFENAKVTNDVVVMPVIHSQRTIDRLSKGNIRCPSLDENILRNYFAFFESSGFIVKNSDIELA